MSRIQKMRGESENLEKPVASHFAEFDTTQNVSELQINDIVFPLIFNLGKIGIFWLSFHCLWPEDQLKAYFSLQLPYKLR